MFNGARKYATFTAAVLLMVSAAVFGQNNVPFTISGSGPSAGYAASVQNTNTAAYSGFTLLDSAGNIKGAIGWGNSATSLPNTLFLNGNGVGLNLQTGGGNVSIGTSSANATLNMYGDATFSSNIAVNGAVLAPWQLGKAIQGTTGALFLGLAGDIHIVSNGYVTSSGTGWKYLGNGTAANEYMYLGDTIFRTAPSGVKDADLTWTNTFVIKANGNVGVATVTPNEKFAVYGSNIRPIIGDSTTHTQLYSGYNAQAWNALEIYTAGGNGAGLVLTNNALSGTMGAISFANKAAGTEGTNDLRVAEIFGETDGAANSGHLTFYTASGGTNGERMRINSTGVSVTGSITATGNITTNGSISGATVLGAVYQDIAEWVPASSELRPGTVVILDPAASNQVTSSQTAYDTSVAGVVSAQPGVILGRGGEMKAKVATVGRVKVRVDASKHPVRIGDLLVTSDKPGVAMVSEPVDLGGVKIHRPGTLIGKALEPLSSGEGDVLVLLSLQ